MLRSNPNVQNSYELVCLTAILTKHQEDRQPPDQAGQIGRSSCLLIFDNSVSHPFQPVK